MRWVEIDRRVRVSLHPPARQTTTRKQELVDTGRVDHRQLEIAVERCGCYGLPVHNQTLAQTAPIGFDANQFSSALFQPASRFKCRAGPPGGRRRTSHPTPPCVAEPERVGGSNQILADLERPRSDGRLTWINAAVDVSGMLAGNLPERRNARALLGHSDNVVRDYRLGTRRKHLVGKLASRDEGN